MQNPVPVTHGLCSAGGTHSASALSTLFSWNNETLNAWTIIMGVWVTAAGILYMRQAPGSRHEGSR